MYALLSVRVCRAGFFCERTGTSFVLYRCWVRSSGATGTSSRRLAHMEAATPDDAAVCNSHLCGHLGTQSTRRGFRL